MRKIFLKTFLLIMLAGVSIISSCGGGKDPIPPAPPVDLSGVWAGTWSGLDPVYGPVSGNWTAEIDKYGYRFSASARFTGDVDCPDGQLSGAVGAPAIASGTINRPPCQANAWTLTAVSLRERSAGGFWLQSGSGAQGAFSGSQIATPGGPRIMYFSPPAGSSDAIVTVVGSGFNSASTVAFSTIAPSEVLSARDPSSTIIVRLPAGETSGPMIVSTPVGTALSPRAFNGKASSPKPVQKHTIQVSSGPEGVAYSPDGRRVFTAEKGSGRITMVDAHVSRVLRTTFAGSSSVVVPVQGIVVDPGGGKVYVASGSGITVLDAVTNSIVETIPVNAGGGTPPNPQGIAISNDGQRLFISDNHVAGVVTVLNRSNNQIIATVPGSANGVPRGIAVNPDNREAYLLFSGSNEMKVYDMQLNMVTDSVPVGADPVGIAVTPDGTTACITNSSDNSVSVIDIASRQTSSIIPVGASPLGIAVTPDGQQAFVANQAGNSISVIDMATRQATTVIPVGVKPTGIAISPDGMQAYVTNAGDSSVSEIGGQLYLTIMKPGLGLGTVTSSPDGILCGTNCQSPYLEGTVVYLNVSVDKNSGQYFKGWSGDPDCSDGVVTMDDNKVCNADFGELGGCFIATAAYGSDMAPEVQVLREFRNEYLLTNTAGKILVDIYNEVSPPVADYIRSREALKTTVRMGLKPVIHIIVYPWSSLLLVCGMVIFVIFLRRASGKYHGRSDYK